MIAERPIIQPALPPNTPNNIPERNRLTRAHRSAIMDYCKANPGVWVIYWESYGGYGVSGSKDHMIKYLFGGNRFIIGARREHHGRNFGHIWSLRVKKRTLQLRYNYPDDPDDRGVLDPSFRRERPVWYDPTS